jgi:hypothetical protein
MKIIFQLAVTGLVLVTILGCARPTGMIRNISPISVNQQTSLDVIQVTTFSSLEGVESEKRLLNDQIVSDLRESGLFSSVGENSADLKPGDGIKITNDIKEIKRVSDHDRDWTGVLAGQARILVRVTVSDLKSGKEIEVFEVEGKSGRSAYGGTTEEAVQRSAEQVTGEIERINAQTAQ